MLRETAATYNATISPADLAEQVQRRSRLRSSAATRSWLNGVLGIVAVACHGRDVPPLTSLVVNPHDGRVGPAYDHVLKAAGQELLDDLARERHAAAARLECYRRFCAAVPEDAVPTLTPQVRQLANRTPRKAAVVESRAPICPRCFLQLPLAGGSCPNCD